MMDLMAWLESPERTAGVKAHAKNSARYIRDYRYKATGVTSQAKKHINIAGGRANSEAISLALLEAQAWVVQRMRGRLSEEEAKEMVAVVPAPLLLSTQHMLMGIQPSSTSTTMKELLTLACADVGDRDPHLSMQLKKEAKWTNHSLRRHADTEARRWKESTAAGRRPVTTQEIDLYFGWHEMELSKDMQIHYATLSLAERIGQARITCMT